MISQILLSHHKFIQIFKIIQIFIKNFTALAKKYELPTTSTIRILYYLISSASLTKKSPIKKFFSCGKFKACEALKSGAYYTYVSILKASITPKSPIKKFFSCGKFKACEALKSGAYYTYVSILKASITQKFSTKKLFTRIGHSSGALPPHV